MIINIYIYIMIILIIMILMIIIIMIILPEEGAFERLRAGMPRGSEDQALSSLEDFKIHPRGDALEAGCSDLHDVTHQLIT